MSVKSYKQESDSPEGSNWKHHLEEIEAIENTDIERTDFTLKSMEDEPDDEFEFLSEKEHVYSDEDVASTGGDKNIHFSEGSLNSMIPDLQRSRHPDSEGSRNSKNPDPEKSENYMRPDSEGSQKSKSPDPEMSENHRHPDSEGSQKSPDPEMSENHRHPDSEGSQKSPDPEGSENHRRPDSEESQKAIVLESAVSQRNMTPDLEKSERSGTAFSKRSQRTTDLERPKETFAPDSERPPIGMAFYSKGSHGIRTRTPDLKSETPFSSMTYDTGKPEKSGLYFSKESQKSMSSETEKPDKIGTPFSEMSQISRTPNLERLQKTVTPELERPQIVTTPKSERQQRDLKSDPKGSQIVPASETGTWRKSVATDILAGPQKSKNLGTDVETWERTSGPDLEAREASTVGLDGQDMNEANEINEHIANTNDKRHSEDDSESRLSSAPQKSKDKKNVRVFSTLTQDNANLDRAYNKDTSILHHETETMSSLHTETTGFSRESTSIRSEPSAFYQKYITNAVSTEESRALLRARLGLPAAGAQPPVAIETRVPSEPSGASTPRTHTSSMLINAAARGDADLVHQVLSTTHTDPDSKKRYQDRSALHLACGYGQVSVVKELLNAGADPDNASRMGRTPLHEACQGGHVEVLKVLLDYTRHVNAADIEGLTPAHLAAFNGEVQCLEVLADRRASLVSEDRLGRQPCHLAAIRNHRGVLEMLYSRSVDLESSCDAGKLPMHYAAQHGALDSLVCLIERDCDIAIGDSSGNLPIHYAACHDHVTCVSFLVRQGSSALVTQAEGKTPLHVASYHGACKVLHWLLEKTGQVNVTDGFGNTAAHYAAERGKAKCFSCLVKHGADLQALNHKSDSPLDSAKKSGHPLLIAKAVSGEIICKDCHHLMRLDDWERKHGAPHVLKSVSQLKARAYTNPLPKASATLGRFGSYGNGTTHDARKKFPKRDLATKYIGEHIHTEIYRLKFS